MRVSRLTGFAAYVVTLRGAARILYDQSLVPNATLIDVAISHLCHDNTLTCYGAYPMLMGRYRAIGPKTRDSDRRTSSNAAEKGSGGGQNGDVRGEGESEFTVFPASLNLGKLMSGESMVVTNGKEKDVREVDLRVEGEVVSKGEGVRVGRGEYVD